MVLFSSLQKHFCRIAVTALGNLVGKSDAKHVKLKPEITIN